MSSDLLADLDSFYRQQSEANGNDGSESESEDFGDFQRAQKAVFEEKQLKSHEDIVQARHIRLHGEQSKLHNEKSAVKKDSPQTSKNPDLIFDVKETIGSEDASESTSTGFPERHTSSSEKRPSTSMKTNKTYLLVNERTGVDNITDQKTLKVLQANDKKKRSKETHATVNSSNAKVTATDEEFWEDFALTPAGQLSNSEELDNEKPFSQPEFTHLTGQDELELPPTNIPPPALLLTLFTHIFTESRHGLLMIVDKTKQQPSGSIEKSLTIFLHSVMDAARVLARTISGRKLRWKRDQILSQNMKIGPATTKGVSGMKLAGIDKAESGKEEKEILDVLDIWREQLGRLRSAVATIVRNDCSQSLHVPDVRLNMPVKALQESEGGISSTRPCALCGLKRNERVSKVDEDIHDSFGEWWNDATCMHRTCQSFWQSNRSRLSAG